MLDLLNSRLQFTVKDDVADNCLFTLRNLCISPVDNSEHLKPIEWGAISSMIISCSFLTLDIATYAIPRVNTFVPRFRTAFGNVAPCTLCIVVT